MCIVQNPTIAAAARIRHEKTSSEQKYAKLVDWQSEPEPDDEDKPNFAPEVVVVLP